MDYEVDVGGNGGTDLLHNTLKLLQAALAPLLRQSGRGQGGLEVLAETNKGLAEGIDWDGQGRCLGWAGGGLHSLDLLDQADCGLR